MKLQVQVRGLPDAARLRRLATDRLTAVLDGFAHAVQEARLQLDDLNGPDRGGVDKLCRLVLQLRDSSVLVVEELGSDLIRVIDRVALRVQERLARQLPAAG